MKRKLAAGFFIVGAIIAVALCFLSRRSSTYEEMQKREEDMAIRKIELMTMDRR